MYRYNIKDLEEGNLVTVHYTGKNTDGTIFDSSKERKDPFKFQVGSGQIIPGFENTIMGKKVGDKVTATLKPEEVYGNVREELIVKVDNDKLPGKVEIG